MIEKTQIEEWKNENLLELNKRIEIRERELRTMKAIFDYRFLTEERVEKK